MGFWDLLSWLLGWKSYSGTAGPYTAAAGEVFCAGGSAGATAADIYTAGGHAGQIVS